MIFLDVRTPEEYAEAHAEGAILLPVNSLVAGDLGPLGDAEKSTPIRVYCRSGGRAARAKVALELLGFTDVENVGGVDDARRMALGH